jgi:hypothetical protein
MPTKSQTKEISAKNNLKTSNITTPLYIFIAIIIVIASSQLYVSSTKDDRTYVASSTKISTTTTSLPLVSTSTPLGMLASLSSFAKIYTGDKKAYDEKMEQLANNPHTQLATTTNATGTKATTTPKVVKKYPWPVAPIYPRDGALLPFNRIVAYYGNFYSKKMGILGEYDEATVLAKLKSEMTSWKAADPHTPIIPAIHYIVAVAQADKGKDGDYLARMPDEHIERAIKMTDKINGITFLDIQIAHSSAMKEVKAIEQYLAMPKVHLGLDPEFSMKESNKPGHVIGTLDASEINEVIQEISRIVRENNLPPKILILHRFTFKMITNSQFIKPTPEVQVIIDMDGWGSPQLKKNIYHQVITDEPVQFSGIKLFYKNDMKAPSTRLLTPVEVLNFTPRPSYIQYQ